jgi:hypothetical protein
MRTDVRPTGRADVRCPGDRCPHHRCDPGVRTDRRPVSTASAAARPAPRWILEGVGAAGPATSGTRVRRVAVVGERLGRRCPNRAWRQGMVERWPCAAGTRVDASPGPPLGMRTGCGAALAAWPTKGAGPAPGASRVGWGAREGAGAPKSPTGASWAGCRRDARPWAGPGRWSPRSVVVALVVVPCRPALEGPSGSAGNRLRPQRGRDISGALSARSCQRAELRERWWARQGLNL